MKKPIFTLIVYLLVFTGSMASFSEAEEKYDIILKGGFVIDPANNINEVMDVAIRDSVIVRVDKNIATGGSKSLIDNEGAVKVVDVSGYYVTPGIIDIHQHVYSPSRFCLKPDHHCFLSGITTVVDAGSSGANTFEYFKETVIDSSRVRVLAFLNIAAPGMAADQYPEHFNVPLAVLTARKYPGIIVGFKSAHYMGGNYEGLHKPWVSVDAIEEAARLTGLPAMHDFRQRPPIGDYPARTYRELVLEKMRPGDIHTHFLAPQFEVILEDGNINPDLIKARKRGIHLDLGHGQGSFVFRYAVPATSHRFRVEYDQYHV